MATESQEMKATARVPPFNLEAEMSVLGALMLEKDLVPGALQRIKSSSFYKPAHGRIFDALVKLHDSGQPVDIITLTESLRRTGELDSVGGAAYLTTLINYLPTAAHFESYIKIVAEKAILRSLISATAAIVDQCYQEKADSSVLLDEVEKQVFSLIQQRSPFDFAPMVVLVKQAMETIERLEEVQGMITGISTGFKDLDVLTCGLQPSELVVLAARPSMGKTALALNIAEQAAVRNSQGVGVFSLEMSREQLVLRLLCAHARVDAQNMRRGFLSQKDWVKLANSAGTLSEAPIYIDDSPSLSPLEIRARARNMKAKHDIKLLIVDYLQLIQLSGGRTESRQQEVSEISRSLKSLARELKIPVLVLSQLNREAENRPDKRPRLSDLRESGAIEQDSDVVMLMMRPSAYPDHDEKDSNKVYINIAKQRNGPTGEKILAFLDKYTRFENYTELESDE